MFTLNLKIKFKFFLLLFVSYSSIFSENIVTTKDDLPDGYYGLKLGAVISPSFGYRVRDSSSGVSNTKRDDRTGFSMPWTLFMISKEWEEKKITVEFWGEILRSSVITADTPVDSGSKANAYILGIRRASVKKNIEYGIFNMSFLFGIHELPHVYTQWKGYWKWRYVDKAPAEVLGFSSHPADLGTSFIVQVKRVNIHLGIVNGEGYRDMQNTDSSGYDGVSRISFEPEFSKLKMGFHFLGRAGNFIGVAGNECREGNTTCVENDRNVRTRLERDLRFQKSQTFGFEYTLLFDKYINFGAGLIERKIFQGITFNKLNLSTYPDYRSDVGKSAIYAWLGFGFWDFNFVFRTEQGIGIDGTLATSTSSLNTGFKRNSFFSEYVYSDSVRFAMGASELRQGSKVYVDYLGDLRTERAYQNQFFSGVNSGIVEYSFFDRQIFLKSTMDF